MFIGKGCERIIKKYWSEDCRWCCSGIWRELRCGSKAKIHQICVFERTFSPIVPKSEFGMANECALVRFFNSEMAVGVHQGAQGCPAQWQKLLLAKLLQHGLGCNSTKNQLQRKRNRLSESAYNALEECPFTFDRCRLWGPKTTQMRANMGGNWVQPTFKW